MWTFFVWCLLFVNCWPLAFLALLLYPVVWLLLLPFRLIGITVDAVFEHEDTTVVYERGGARRAVTVGARGDDFVIVSDGLSEGDAVRLADPTRLGPRADGEARP